MKRLFIFVIMIVFLSGCIWTQAVKEYDRFTGKTSIYSFYPESAAERDQQTQPVLIFQIMFKGTITPKAPIVYGMFLSMSDDWKFLDFYDVHILADNMPIKTIGKSIHKGDVTSGSVHETVLFQISFEEFLKMADAIQLEFKVGLTEFAARPEELRDIQSFKDLILK